jgi:hypothetical protein
MESQVSSPERLRETDIIIQLQSLTSIESMYAIATKIPNRPRRLVEPLRVVETTKTACFGRQRAEIRLLHLNIAKLLRFWANLEGFSPLFESVHPP